MNLPVLWHNQSFTYQQLSQVGADLLTDSQANLLSDKHHIARQILCIACNIDKVKLITDVNTLVLSSDIEKYYTYLMRFNNHEPLSRLEWIKNFYGFVFEISKENIDTRPKTTNLIYLF